MTLDKEIRVTYIYLTYALSNHHGVLYNSDKMCLVCRFFNYNFFSLESICRHTSVVYSKKIWVLGGESRFNSVNDFFTIDLESFQVNHLKINVRI